MDDIQPMVAIAWPALSVGVILFVALIVLGGASSVPGPWLVPYFLAVPLYFSLKLEELNQTIGNAPNRFGAIAVLALVVIPAALAAQSLYAILAPH